MASTFRIYKGNTVVLEGLSPLTLVGLNSGTDYPFGTYEVVRMVGKLESKRVKLPAFKTLGEQSGGIGKMIVGKTFKVG